MNDISEYNGRQLKLMYECLASFEKNQIELSSLIGSLEFLLNAMELVDEDWENKFLQEVTTLESGNNAVVRVRGVEGLMINWTARLKYVATTTQKSEHSK